MEESMFVGGQMKTNTLFLHRLRHNQCKWLVYFFKFVGMWMLLSVANAAIPLQQIAQMTGQEMPSLAPMLEVVTPAVVNISTRGRVRVQDNPLLRDPFFKRFFNIPDRPRERATQSLGSGVVVDASRGYVITNNHVIDKADEITVTLRDGRKLKAQVIGTDPESDVAVIQISAENLTTVKLADSTQLRVGDFVVAIGNPFGLGQTVTSGIVSALGRSGLGIEGFEDFIQTDASINPGNSGGALVNLQGRLVGINTAIFAPTGSNVGIGFAIPANMMRDIMEQLIEFGEVKRGRLGVYIQDLTPALARAFGLGQFEGAVISQIVPESSADRGGLLAGDVIVSINSRRVTSSADLRNLIGLLRVGQKVKVDIIRDGMARELTVLITAAESLTLSGDSISPRLQGAKLSINDMRDRLSKQTAGILIRHVEPGSAAWHVGLRKGDVLASVNRRPVRDFTELRQAITASRRSLLLNIFRDDGALFLLIE